MKTKLESYLHIATALVSAAAPFFLDSVATGLLLAAISVAHAANALAKEDRNRQT